MRTVNRRNRRQGGEKRRNHILEPRKATRAPSAQLRFQGQFRTCADTEPRLCRQGTASRCITDHCKPRSTAGNPGNRRRPQGDFRQPQAVQAARQHKSCSFDTYQKSTQNNPAIFQQVPIIGNPNNSNGSKLSILRAKEEPKKLSTTTLKREKRCNSKLFAWHNLQKGIL